MPDPQIRQQAIRVSETLYKAGDRTLGNDYKNLTKDADVEVVLQAMMTLNTLRVADAATEVIKATQDANKARGVQLVANSMLWAPVVVAADVAAAADAAVARRSRRPRSVP